MGRAVREDGNVCADPSASVDVDFSTVIDTCVFTDENIVEDANVVTIGATEARLNLHTRT